MVVFVDREWWSTIIRNVWKYHRQTSPRDIDAVTDQHTKEERLHKWHLLGQLRTFFCCLLCHHIQSLLPRCRLHPFLLCLSQSHRHEYVLHSNQVH
jgi:hypothetical protein